MLWECRRGTAVTTLRPREILSAASPAGGCSRTGWQSRAVFTTWLTWLRFAAIIHALNGPCARRSDIFEELGDRTGAAWCISQQGDIARAQDDLAAARGLYQRALSVFRETGDPWGSARSLTDLAYIDCEQGNHQAAHAACSEALEIFAGLGHRRGIARALEGSACLALAQGHAERALKLAVGRSPLTPVDQRSSASSGTKQARADAAVGLEIAR